MEHEPIAADQIELLNRYASSPADPAALVAPGAVGTNVETVSKPPLIALHTGLEEALVRKQFSDYDLFMPKVDDADVLLKLIAGVLVAESAKAAPAASV